MLLPLCAERSARTIPTCAVIRHVPSILGSLMLQLIEVRSRSASLQHPSTATQDLGALLPSPIATIGEVPALGAYVVKLHPQVMAWYIFLC